MNMEQLQKENDELRAHVERLCEWANCLALTTHERWGKMVGVLQETPAQSLRHIKSRVEEETIEECISVSEDYEHVIYAVEALEKMPRKYKEQADEGDE